MLELQHQWLTFSLLFSQTITPAPLISSNATTIAAFQNDGFVTEPTTAVAMRMRPTLHARVCAVLYSRLHENQGSVDTYSHGSHLPYFKVK